MRHQALLSLSLSLPLPLPLPFPLPLRRLLLWCLNSIVLDPQG